MSRTPIPKPIRHDKERKPLKRTAIKAGSRCETCRGFGTTYWGASKVVCPDCSGTGRIASKPIKRSKIDVRGSSGYVTIPRGVDEAKFPPEVSEAIFPDQVCVLTGIRHNPAAGVFVDPMHILGRHGGQKMFSSPYNFCWGFRGFHASAYRDWPESRALLLKIARRKVDQAIERGLYDPSDNDAAFLSYAEGHLPDFYIAP